MKTRRDMVELVCRPHCRFFRPGEKEELSCGGYDFLAARLDDERARKLKELVGAASVPSRFDHDERIEAVLCRSCEFREADCDFMSGEEPAGAVPCGGYVLLRRLKDLGFDEALEWLHEG